MAYISIAVEGRGDVPIVRRVLTSAGHEIAVVHGQRGKGTINRNIGGYNNAARFAPWLVLRDLNSDATCAAELIQKLLPKPSAHMRLRIAVRSAEAWLLADVEQIAKFLHVSRSLVPATPETLPDPKTALVNIARKSKVKRLRDDMVPAPGTTARVGPAYTARIIEFARDFWRPSVAAVRSDSLARCITRVTEWKP